ncbi:MAG: hypothetical protein WCA95_01200 [Opitutaceae bacterium]
MELALETKPAVWRGQTGQGCLERTSPRNGFLTFLPFGRSCAMTMLELKQEVSRLSIRERRELNAFMIRLRHERPEWKRMISKRLRDMDAGKKVSVEDLKRRLAIRA